MAGYNYKRGMSNNAVAAHTEGRNAESAGANCLTAATRRKCNHWHLPC